MYIDAETIIKFEAVLGAVLFIGGIILIIYNWTQKPKQNSKDIKSLKAQHVSDIKEIKDELCMLSYAMLAALDGLKQLNCNGEVTKAHTKLSKHINEQAHDRKGEDIL